MNNGQKIKYMELCLAVAREEVEYAELYKEKEPDYDEDFVRGLCVQSMWRT